MVQFSFSSGSRLDKFLVSRELLSPGVECNISPCPISDHDFVSLVFDIPTGVKRGPGVWNFNNSLLKDKDFCTTIEKLIDCHLRFFTLFRESSGLVGVFETVHQRGIDRLFA